MLVGVAGGIPANPYDMTGMFIRGIHFFSGKILLTAQMGTGRTAPMRNSQTRFLYSPPGPKSRLGPINPHMTEASNVTRYFGQVHGLSGCRASTSQMFSMLSSIHHATPRLTIAETKVPTSYTQKILKEKCHLVQIKKPLITPNLCQKRTRIAYKGHVPGPRTYNEGVSSCNAQV